MALGETHETRNTVPTTRLDSVAFTDPAKGRSDDSRRSVGVLVNLRDHLRSESFDQGASVREDLPADYNAVIVVLEREGFIGSEAKFVTAGDVAWLTRGDTGRASEVALRAEVDHYAPCCRLAVHCA
jgi:hypothetical protein